MLGASAWSKLSLPQGNLPCEPGRSAAYLNTQSRRPSPASFHPPIYSRARLSRHMDPYTFCLLLGGLGLGAMAVTGVGHHGHAGGHGHGHAHLHAGAKHAAGPARAAGAGAPTHAGAGAGHVTAGVTASRALLSHMSPRVLVSVLLGIGTTGVLLRNVVGGAILLGAALAGGALFELVIARPVWNFAMRFASKPALTLESCVMDSATAVTSFDGHGQGLVAVELDGQMVQILATLLPAERAAGATVRAGDRVRIDAVDAAQNRCTVSLN
jgi:hypothetical protein